MYTLILSHINCICGIITGISRIAPEEIFPRLGLVSELGLGLVLGLV